MKIQISGNIGEYYVQTLCMLFFPGVKFSKAESADSALSAVVSVEDMGDTVSAMVTLTNERGSETASASEEKNAHAKVSSEQIACGKAFFEAGRKLTGLNPSWGILTGVRPAKLAIADLNHGKSKNEVRNALTKEYLVTPKKASLVTEIAAVEKEIIDRVKPTSCSLYISIPFCPSRCSYCSFVSFTSAKLLGLLDSYLERLCHDINETVDTIRELGLDITTVYIGGGTPTTLNEKQLQILLDAITARIDPATLEEFTVEGGRPDTITEEKLRIIHEHGVNRVSINTQTLNDDVLELVGRKHTSAEFYRAFEMARKANIPIINTDLIAGLPGEGFCSFSDTIDRIIELRPENLTFHTLAIKNAADFAQQKDHMKSMHMFSETSKCVDYSQLSAKNAGYIPYYIYRQKNTVNNLENVGFALPGTEGLYNIYMMEEIQTIFAVGAGAVSKMVSRDGKSIERIFEYKYPYEYLADPDGMKNKEKREKSLHFYHNIW